MTKRNEPQPASPRAIDALLAGYATGSLEPHLHALIECHLILSDENRAVVRALEEAAAAEMEAAPAPPPSRAARDQVLAAIYTGGWYGRPRPPKLDPDVPQPLELLLKRPLSDIPWRFAGPGLGEHRLYSDGCVSASLLCAKPGCELPQHDHQGVEATLVLRGAFSDETGRYRRGDVAVAGPSLRHRPVADSTEGCVCFVVMDGPIRLTSMIGRLAQRLLGR